MAHVVADRRPRETNLPRKGLGETCPRGGGFRRTEQSALAALTCRLKFRGSDTRSSVPVDSRLSRRSDRQPVFGENGDRDSAGHSIVGAARYANCCYPSLLLSAGGWVRAGAGECGWSGGLPGF